jgi:hypothetical protein
MLPVGADKAHAPNHADRRHVIEPDIGVEIGPTPAWSLDEDLGHFTDAGGKSGSQRRRGGGV